MSETPQQEGSTLLETMGKIYQLRHILEELADIVVNHRKSSDKIDDNEYQELYARIQEISAQVLHLLNSEKDRTNITSRINIKDEPYSKTRLKQFAEYAFAKGRKVRIKIKGRISTDGLTGSVYLGATDTKLLRLLDGLDYEMEEPRYSESDFKRSGLSHRYGATGWPEMTVVSSIEITLNDIDDLEKILKHEGFWELAFHTPWMWQEPNYLRIKDIES